MNEPNKTTVEEIQNTTIEILSKDGSFPELTKDRELYVILVNGKRLKTNSGKSVWTNVGAAKNALRHHIQSLYSEAKFHLGAHRVYDERGVVDYQIMVAARNETEKEWIAKHVVFMPFDKYMAVRRKRK